MKAADMTEGQLRKALERCDTESSALCSEFIAAGRGFEKPTQTRLLSDPLAMRWKDATARHSEFRAERDRRMTWHGSLKRIRAT